MMKYTIENSSKIFLLLTFVLVSFYVNGQQNESVVTEDITRFWDAYDQIVEIEDSLEQIEKFKELYIDKGTDGLHAIMQAKRYTAEIYVNAINAYPKFWSSIRNNTTNCKNIQEELSQGIEELKALYPDLKPAKIYYTIGALWTPGTTIDNMVLIGAELALANSNTAITEFTKEYTHLPSYFQTNPNKDIVFLNIHEYVHTQQKKTVGKHLLAQTVIEGVAEFVAVKALQIESPNPQIKFGLENNEKIKKAFQKEMFSPYFSNWLWSNKINEFKMRDLAYYVGYIICENYYLDATDKKQAIKEMIELDYNNDEDLCAFVDQANYFDFSTQLYLQKFERERPKVVEVVGITNGDVNVDPSIESITIEFSEALDTQYVDFNCDLNDEAKCLPFTDVSTFENNGKSYVLKVELEPNSYYQLWFTQYFSNSENAALQPYLLQFKTGE